MEIDENARTDFRAVEAEYNLITMAPSSFPRRIIRKADISGMATNRGISASIFYPLRFFISRMSKVLYFR